MKVIINHARKQHSREVIFYISNRVLHGALLAKISKFGGFFLRNSFNRLCTRFLTVSN